MADLRPIPLSVLVARLYRELARRKAVYDLPRRAFFEDAGGRDLGVSIHGHRAAMPFGPAAGPHTQMAQNILLSWLAGGRVIELKTVQILDALDIARPCIDMETIGYNIEWSQELRLEQSLEEYVKAAMLVEIATSAGLGAALPDTVFDMSVGYDLAGIQSDRVGAFLSGMRDATAVVEALRAQIPDEYAHLRDLPYATRISDTVTLSTFHGCPPSEIEAIAAHLLREAGLNVVVKLNPTLLGADDVRAILNDRLGYADIAVPDAAFANDPTWAQVEGMVERLGRLAGTVGRGFGVKFTNTLLVRNHRDFFPAEAAEMYLSGPPLHVLAIALVGRFRARFGDRFPISFSAGIDVANFADSVALGLKPVSVCTDMLKNGGYARGGRYLKALTERMDACGATDIDTFVLCAFDQAGAALDGLGLPPHRADVCRAALDGRGDLRAAAGDDFERWVAAARVLNTQAYDAQVAADPRYGAEATNTPPRRTDATLGRFDCQTCDRCITVCPNNAIFPFTLPRGPIADGGPTIVRQHQIGVFADACNECGNCDVICPEFGAPYRLKPNFFGSLAAWAEAARDGFFVESLAGGTLRLHGRLDGVEVVLDRAADGALRCRGDGAAGQIMAALLDAVAAGDNYVAAALPAADGADTNA